MPKPKYVLTCLTWSLCFSLGTLHAVNTVTKQQATNHGSLSEVTKGPRQTATPAEAPAVSDSDTPAQEQGKALEHIINYGAEGSMLLDLKHKTIRVHGTGVIEYDAIKLEAEEVFLDWTNHTFAAFSKKNKAGEVEEKAVLTKDGVEYIAENVRYNFDSQRAVANKLFTKQDDGILRVNRIKKDRKDTFYADHGTYTTCDLPKPHFHIGVQQLKLIQDDQVVSGPFNLHFDDVPTPLGFLFGVFYFPKGSGIITPVYGGESSKGYSLKDGGYYIKFNDYADLALKGTIHSKGSTAFNAESRYKKRYQYRGDLSYKRSTDRNSHYEEELTKKIKSWRFKWNHRTENNRTSSLAAEVNLQSEKFRAQNPLSGSAGLQASMNSSIRYTNKLVGLPYTLNTSLRYTKNFQSKNAKATIPSTSLRTGNIYPFRKRGGHGGNWYTDIYIQHKVDFENKLSNTIGNETLDFSPKNWKRLFKNGQYGVNNTVPLKTNIKILGYLNLTPTIQYRERWYWKQINYKRKQVYSYDLSAGVLKRNKIKIREEKISGFKRVYDYDFGGGLTTTLYGTHFFSRNATIQAIRHQIEPVVSFTYTPDFSHPRYGYWQTIAGKKYNRFKDAIYGAPRDRATAVMRVALNNRLDMKVKSNAYSKESTKKIPILEGLNLSTGYDFLEKECPLEDIDLRARTRLFDDLFDISFNATFDPYVHRKKYEDNLEDKKDSPKEKKVPALAWNCGKGIGRATRASLSIGTKLSPERRDSSLKQYDDMEEEQDVEEELRHIQEHPEQYVDFNIPWSLGLAYTWFYESPEPGKSSTTKTMNFDGDISLTPKWKVTLGSAYNITERKWVDTLTRIGIHRDLHCWEMNFNWRPLGNTQYFEFSIGVKSPLLQYLKYNRDKSYSNP